MSAKTKSSECVKVVVRCRPLNRKEIEENHENVVDMDLKLGQVQVKNPKSKQLLHINKKIKLIQCQCNVLIIVYCLTGSSPKHKFY